MSAASSPRSSRICPWKSRSYKYRRASRPVYQKRRSARLSAFYEILGLHRWAFIQRADVDATAIFDKGALQRVQRRNGETVGLGTALLRLTHRKALQEIDFIVLPQYRRVYRLPMAWWRYSGSRQNACEMSATFDMSLPSYPSRLTQISITFC